MLRTLKRWYWRRKLDGILWEQAVYQCYGYAEYIAKTELYERKIKEYSL